MDINQLQWIGAEDQYPDNSDEYVHKALKGSNETVELIQEILGSLQVDHRSKTTRDIYNHLNVPATFRIVDGIRHSSNTQIRNEVRDYHHKEIVEEYDVIHFVPQNVPTELPVPKTMTVTLTVENPTDQATTTIVDLTVDGTKIRAVERDVAPHTSTTIKFEHTFEEPGSYTLSINDRQIVDSPLTVTEPTPTSHFDSKHNIHTDHPTVRDNEQHWTRLRSRGHTVRYRRSKLSSHERARRLSIDT